MDWVNDFVERFKLFKEIQSLRADKFHGTIELNFSDGVVVNYNFKMHRRVEKIQT